MNPESSSPSSSKLRKQKQLGPAPIASFEDTSDENRHRMEANGEAATKSTIGRLANISELPQQQQQQICTESASTSAHNPATAATSTATATAKPALIINSKNTNSDGSNVGGTGTSSSGASLTVHTPSTPRIDISRASSSSHHDSRDSSPENVFEQVGTGTLQETQGGLGFREDGALDLRSSTEELFFMEPEKGKTECEKPSQPNRRSPVVFKFDEHHQACLQQHQRKDSASSEVASFLCISGRTSRISSVGSQGSATSRLSAVSGVSRSPSPHRMLLETSFCGPKPLQGTTDGSVLSSIEPLTAEMLEQVILARKHDPTQAVLAEGIKIDSSSSLKPAVKARSQQKSGISNGVVVGNKKPDDDVICKTPEVRITKPSQPSSMRVLGKKPSAKETPKKIVGFMPSGTEYIRIKLKPDHLYDDKGIAQNERVLDEASDSQKKPDTLNLGPQKTQKKAAPHFSQLVKSEDIISKHPEQKTVASPKPVRHTVLARETESRSPSPATVSRKSSFCTLFKSKENSASPDSPTTVQRKKSSTLSTPDGSRSRSKSRDKEPSSTSQNSTPSKQKSVLTIFKPKCSGSKSKSNSPVDPETATSLEGISHLSDPHVKNVAQDSRDRSKERLRYYDSPLDGKSVHIPLHTPPEEKDIFKSSAPVVAAKSNSLTATSGGPIPTTAPIGNHSASLTRESLSAHKSIIQETPKSRSVQKLSRIENADGSIIIPLHSPSEERERESTWSMEVQRHSSQESQETVIYTHTNSQINEEILAQTVHLKSVVSEPPNVVSEPVELSEQIANKLDTTSPANGLSSSTIPTSVPVAEPITATTNITTTTATTPATSAATGSATTSANKRHILFCTKIGSGSEEQIFSTQLSLSKTESQSSQLSEQAEESASATIFDSPINDNQGKGQKTQTEANKSTGEKSDANVVPAAVIMRKKSNDNSRKSKQSMNADDDDDEVFNRHSRYFENPEEIMETQKKLEALRAKKREFKKKMEEPVTPIKDEVIATKTESVLLANSKSKSSTDRASMISTDDPGGSSESERESEADSNRIKRHLPRNLGNVDEHESTGLVFQESFDDELPYVPTTLPEERSVGIKLVPAKERAQIDVKTYSVERPRSTTPIHPASLQNYCGTNVPEENENLLSRTHKLRISLPKRSSGGEEAAKDKTPNSKSPRRVSNAMGKCWFEFAEQGIGTTTAATVRKNSASEDDAPPVPPRKQSQPTTQWVNFENIPEKRKPPKRITTLPNKEMSDVVDRSATSAQQYSYVNPEDCQCECHENERDSVKRSTPDIDITPEETMPLLETESIEGIDRTSDTSADYSLDADLSGSQHHPHHSMDEHQRQMHMGENLARPFGMDLSVGHISSNRSSIVSQISPTPDLISPNERMKKGDGHRKN